MKNTSEAIKLVDSQFDLLDSYDSASNDKALKEPTYIKKSQIPEMKPLKQLQSSRMIGEASSKYGQKDNEFII